MKMWLKQSDYYAVASFVRLIPLTFSNEVVETFHYEKDFADQITEIICCEMCFIECSKDWKNYLVMVYNGVVEDVWKKTRTWIGAPANHRRLSPVAEVNEEYM